MHTTLRKTLFWFFLVAFFTVGTALIVKAQGFIINWENFSLVRTGGIFIKVLPSDSKIFLDGKLYKKPASFWNSGVLIKNLIPRAYTVRVEREGNLSWEKTLAVEPGLVEAISFIRLFESKPDVKPISSRIIEDFWPVKGGIVEKSGGRLYFGETRLRGNEIIESRPDRNELITGDANLNFFFVSLDDKENVINIRELFASLAGGKNILKKGMRVESVALHPFSPTTVLVRYGSGVFAMDTKKVELSKIIENSGNGTIFTASNEVFWVTTSSVSAYNLLLGVFSQIPLSPHANPYSFKTDVAGSLFFYKNGVDSLYSMERASASSTEITKNVYDFALSQDENLLLVVKNDGRALFYYISEGVGDVKVAKGEIKSFPLSKKFALPSADVIWATNIPSYLFFMKDGELMGAETDIRAPVNAYSLSADVLKAVYRDKKFILLTKDGTLAELSFEF